MRNILFILLFLPFISCKKESLSDEVIGTPVFYLNSEINQDNALFEAGREGYFMETEYEVTDSSLNMIGKLQDLDSVETKRFIEIVIGTTSGVNGNSVDSALKPGNIGYFLSGQKIAEHIVNFNSSINNPAADLTYLWDFGDGSTSTEINPQHRYRFEAGVLKYEVCLRVTSASGSCFSEICSDVVFPSYPSMGSFSYSNNGTSYNYNGDALRGISPFRYEWKFKKLDIPVYTQKVDYNYANMPDNGVDQVCLTLTDAAGRSNTYCENVAVDPLASCMANYTYTATPRIETISSDRSVIVKYHDGKGGVYSSNLSQQDGTSFFNVLNSRSYQSDRKGNNTSLLEIEFDCELKKGNEGLRLKVSDGVIAVAHP